MEKPTSHPLWPEFVAFMETYHLNTPRVFEKVWPFCWDFFASGATAGIAHERQRRRSDTDPAE